MTTENPLLSIKSAPNDLKVVKEWMYYNWGFAMKNLKLNTESVAYGACSFLLNGKKIEYRVAKITPKKAGQFVAIWKRNEKGITQPFDITDDIDFIIITVRSGDDLGQFVFPKSLLADKEIITRNEKEGKRGIRVYPPWDIVTSKQAVKTQEWQTKYFFALNNGNITNLALIRQLFL